MNSWLWKGMPKTSSRKIWTPFGILPPTNDGRNDIMRKQRNWLSATRLIAVTLVALGWTSPAWAPTCPSCTTTSLLLELQGTFFFPPTPCAPSGENVALTGAFHSVTVVGQNFVTDVYLNMAGVVGVGQTTKSLYILTGSTKFVNVQFPPTPCAPNPIQATFTLETTNGCASVPVPVTFGACFSSDGTLQPSSTVSVGGVT
jgi:hypothetical protein